MSMNTDMNPLPSVCEREVFGIEGAVYPGHPVSLAYLIMLKYPSLEAASYRPKSKDPSVQKFPRALSDGDIPCAGGNVYGALDTLKRARDTSPEEAFEYGSDWWRRCASGSNYGNRQEAGQVQAEGIKEAFLAKAAEWVTSTTPPVTAVPLPANHAMLSLVGKEVEWESQSGGHIKQKTGIIVRRVPAGSRPDQRLYPDLYSGAGPGLPRKEASYVIAVEIDRKTAKHYWPRVNLLKLVLD